MWNNQQYIVTIHRIKGSSHFDFRFEVPHLSNKLVSFALPKGFPDNSETFQKYLAVKTPLHNKKMFLNPPAELEVRRGHSTYEIYEKSKVDIIKYKKTIIVLRFHGEKIKGYYTLLNISKENGSRNWIIFKNKNQNPDNES